MGIVPTTKNAVVIKKGALLNAAWAAFAVVLGRAVLLFAQKMPNAPAREKNALFFAWMERPAVVKEKTARAFRLRLVPTKKHAPAKKTNAFLSAERTQIVPVQVIVAS